MFVTKDSLAKICGSLGFSNTPRSWRGVVYFVGWGAFGAPKGTPKPVLEKLSAALKKAASSDEFKQFITSRGMVVQYRNSEECKQFVDSQYLFFNDLLSKMELGK